ncbi:hypothetical protein ACHHYP_08154 [Achlya hypogyna]|uniref:Uncharacterized protein n=1 Tax=Achlya hypogyna TaxID=1202772 RepID=A0A1V9ZL92_ACHHY|nr:hypothetical protein ACHHYP_08154 [Achlya hypogyna]
MQPTSIHCSHDSNEVRRPERPSLPTLQEPQYTEVLTAEDKDIAEAMCVALDDRVIAQVIDILF